MLVYRVSPSGTVTGIINVNVVPATTPPSQLMPQLAGAVAQLGGTHQHDSLTTFGKYAAVLVTYTLPARAGKPAEYGAQAYVHDPASTRYCGYSSSVLRKFRIASLTCTGWVTFEACGAPSMTVNVTGPAKPSLTASACVTGIAASAAPWRMSAGQVISPRRPVMSSLSIRHRNGQVS